MMKEDGDWDRSSRRAEDRRLEVMEAKLDNVEKTVLVDHQTVARLAPKIDQLEATIAAQQQTFAAINQELRDRRKLTEKLSTDVQAVSEQMSEITTGLKAIRWLGVALIGVITLVKTGDVQALKSLFGGGG